MHVPRLQRGKLFAPDLHSTYSGNWVYKYLTNFGCKAGVNIPSNRAPGFQCNCPLGTGLRYLSLARLATRSEREDFP